MQLKKELYSKLEDFFDKLSTKKIGEIKFSEYFKHDGYSIWDNFYRRRFARNMLPPGFNNFDSTIIKLIRKKHSKRKRLKNYLRRKGILFNEIGKIILSKLTEKRLNKNMNSNLLFQIHTNAISFTKHKHKIDRIEEVLNLIDKEKTLKKNMVIISPLSEKISFSILKHKNLLNSFVGLKEIKKAKLASKIISNNWKIVNKKIRFSGLNKQIFNIYHDSFNFFFSKEMIFITILYYETFKKILKINNTKGSILYAPNNITDRCLVYSSDKLNIPSITISHGIGLTGYRWDLPNTHHILTAGELQKKMFIAKGANKNQIRVVGSIFNNKLIRFSKTEDKKKKKKYILFSTSPMVEENVISKDKYFKHISKYLEKLSKIEGYDIIIKPHPLEKNIVEYSKIIKNKNLTNFKIKKAKLGKKHLYSLIKNSDMLITFYSSVIWEASILKKPVVLIDIYPCEMIDKDGVFHKNSKGIPKIKKPEELYKESKKILFNKRYKEKLNKENKEFIKKYCYKLDGKTTTRIIKEIKDIIKNYER